MNRQEFSANREVSFPVGATCYLSLDAMNENIPYQYLPKDMGWSNEARIERRLGRKFLVNAVDTLYDISFWVDKDDITI